jgi:hypothetical protein
MKQKKLTSAEFYSQPALPELLEALQLAPDTSLAAAIALMLEQLVQAKQAQPPVEKDAQIVDRVIAAIAQAQLLFCEPCHELLRGLLKNAGYPPASHLVKTAEGEEAGHWLKNKFAQMSRAEDAGKLPEGGPLVTLDAKPGKPS